MTFNELLAENPSMGDIHSRWLEDEPMLPWGNDQDRDVDRVDAAKAYLLSSEYDVETLQSMDGQEDAIALIRANQQSVRRFLESRA